MIFWTDSKSSITDDAEGMQPVLSFSALLPSNLWLFECTQQDIFHYLPDFQFTGHNSSQNESLLSLFCWLYPKQLRLHCMVDIHVQFQAVSQWKVDIHFQACKLQLAAQISYPTLLIQRILVSISHISFQIHFSIDATSRTRFWPHCSLPH